MGLTGDAWPSPPMRPECDALAMTVGDIGERIAAYRRRRGLSQVALAGLVGLSESWLSQVERGLKPVDKLSVLLDLARVLRVDVQALTGSTWRYAPNGQALAGGLDDLRRAVTRYDQLVGDPPAVVPAMPELRSRIAETHRLYQAAQYDDVIDALPGLLVVVDGLLQVHPGDESERRELLLSYVSAYVVAAKLATKLGAADLSMLTADRASQAAVDADSLAARGMAGYQVACALLRSDQGEQAEQFAVRLAEELERHVRSDDAAVLSLAGALWLIAAVVAARRTDRDIAWQRLSRAETLAGLLGEDANHAWTGFGPTNVAIHRVSVAAELGDAGEALRVAADVNPDRLPAGLRSRRAQVYLDLAWAQAQRKRDAEATLNLLEAERVAPETIKHNVIAQQVVRSLLRRQTRRGTSALTDLAARAGLLE